MSADTYLLLYPLRVHVTLSQPPPRRRLAHCTLPTVLKSYGSCTCFMHLRIIFRVYLAWSVRLYSVSITVINYSALYANLQTTKHTRMQLHGRRVVPHLT